MRIPCGSAIAVWDYSRVALLHFNAESGQLRRISDIAPNDEVFGSALYHCATGQLVYESDPRKISGVAGILHFRDAVRTRILKFDEGINFLFPLNDGSLMVWGKVQRLGDYDAALGDLSEEDKRFNIYAPKANLSASALSDRDGQKYLDVIRFDPFTFSRLGTVRGSVAFASLQNGKFVSYPQIDEAVFEMDPYTGHQQRLIKFRLPWRDDRGPNPNDALPTDSRPQFFTYEGRLFAMTSKQGTHPLDLADNAVYEFSPSRRAWKKLHEFGFMPHCVAMHGSQLVAVGEGAAAVFDIVKGGLQRYRVPLRGFRWSSVAAIDGAWVLGGAAWDVAENPNLPPVARVYVLSRDWQHVLATQEMADMRLPKLSVDSAPVSRMPIPVSPDRPSKSVK